MTTVGRTHLAAVLENLEREAKAAGLMGQDEKLSYERGSRVNGITANLWVGQRGTHAPFVPKWTLRHSQREQLLMMESVAYALFALRMSKVK
jgi:hypothetical protein